MGMEKIDKWPYGSLDIDLLIHGNWVFKTSVSYTTP